MKTEIVKNVMLQNFWDTQYLGQYVTSRDLDLRSHIDLTLQGHYVCICSDAPWREEHDGPQIMPLAFLVEVICKEKKTFRQKQPFYIFGPVAPKPWMLAQK